MSMEQRRNERAEETGDPRVNPPTSGIVLYDSHMQNSGIDRALVGGEAHTLYQEVDSGWGNIHTAQGLVKDGLNTHTKTKAQRENAERQKNREEDEG
ncbi:hypothetical protein PR048_032537 [Dryococelus australis]|uniref:Uncharacterized protein n=1 Tax=Dryococelus australis TaxID=614101 RepID=A0ABQ9G2H0_9NEOP|nr:hypothetical protein PR048_032537 [Dryococelus australis]